MAFGVRQRINWRNFWICFLIASGQLAFGYPASVIGITLGQPAFLLYMDLITPKGTLIGNANGLIGAMGGVFQAGAFFGVLIGAWVNDRFGRKAAVRYCAALSIFGGALLCASQSVGMFIAFRFFAGAGSWGFLSVLPTYTSELAPAEWRGFFVGLNGLFIAIGYCLASYMGLAFYFSTNVVAQWRAPLGMALIWPILIVIITIWTPESPRYLLAVGRTEEAWKIISDLHATRDDPHQEYARSEFYQMRKQAEIDMTLPSSWWEMFRKPSYRKRSLLVMALAFIGQSTGVLVIVNYVSMLTQPFCASIDLAKAPSLYKVLGFNTIDQLALSCGYISVSLPCSLIGAWLLDKVGRRPLLLIATGGCCCCLILEAALVAQYAEAGTNKGALGAAVFAFYFFLCFYSGGIDTGGFVYYAELFPNHLRAKGLALAVATFCITDVVYLQVAGIAFQNIGWKFYLVFIIISGLGFIWMWFNVPETKGIPLEEIAKLFGDEVVVLSQDIHLDHNTHMLVVESHEQGAELTREVTDAYQSVEASKGEYKAEISHVV